MVSIGSIVSVVLSLVAIVIGIVITSTKTKQ